MDDTQEDEDLLNIAPRPAENQKSPDHFEVWPENAAAVECFLRCATQWRVTTAGPIGLDYSVLFSIFDLYDIKYKRDVFEGVQIMEAAVLRIHLKG